MTSQGQSVHVQLRSEEGDFLEEAANVQALSFSVLGISGFCESIVTGLRHISQSWLALGSEPFKGVKRQRRLWVLASLGGNGLY